MTGDVEAGAQLFDGAKAKEIVGRLAALEQVVRYLPKSEWPGNETIAWMQALTQAFRDAPWSEDLEKVFVALGRLVRRFIERLKRDGDFDTEEFWESPAGTQLKKLRERLSVVCDEIAVTRLITLGEQRGYVTYDELNDALPPDRVVADHIERTITRLSKLGVNLIENEDSEELAGVLPETAEQPERAEPAGYVYVFSNPAMPGLYKIGRARDVAARVKALSNGTMVPEDFVIEAVYASIFPERLEREIHAHFDKYRPRKNKEFFKINLSRLKQYVRERGYYLDGHFWGDFSSLPLQNTRRFSGSRTFRFRESLRETVHNELHGHASNFPPISLEKLITELHEITGKRRLSGGFTPIFHERNWNTVVSVYFDLLSEARFMHFGAMVDVGTYDSRLNMMHPFVSANTLAAEQRPNRVHREVIRFLCDRISEFEQVLIRESNASR